MNVLLFTPSLNDRDGAGEITSRIGVSRPAISFDADDDLFVYVRDAATMKPIHCVLIDEAQFSIHKPYANALKRFGRREKDYFFTFLSFSFTGPRKNKRSIAKPTTIQRQSGLGIQYRPWRYLGSTEE